MAFSTALEWALQLQGGSLKGFFNPELIRCLIEPLHILVELVHVGDSRHELVEILLGTLRVPAAMVREDIEYLLGAAAHPLLQLACDVLLICHPYAEHYFAELDGAWHESAVALVGGKVHAAMLAKSYFAEEGGSEYGGFRELCDWTVTFSQEDVIETSFYGPNVDGMFQWEIRTAGANLLHGNCISVALTQIRQYSTGMVDELLSEHLVLAGGCPKRALLTDIGFKDCDLDCWFVGLTTKTELFEELSRAMEVLRKWSVLELDVTIFGSTLSVMVALADDQYDEARIKTIKVQFPLRAYKTAAQVIHSFDMPVVQIAAVKGKDGRLEMVMSEACILALSTRRCLLDPTMSTQTDRILKQLREGFIITAPYGPDAAAAMGMTKMMRASALHNINKFCPGTFSAVLCVHELYKRGRFRSSTSSSYSASGAPEETRSPIPIQLWASSGCRIHRQAWQLMLEPAVEICDPTKRMVASHRRGYIDLARFENSVPAMAHRRKRRELLNSAKFVTSLREERREPLKSASFVTSLPEAFRQEA